MGYVDEKDYIMRMIKEVVRVLFTLMLGKRYVQVELDEQNKYEVSGKNLDGYKKMIDAGHINEAENHLLEAIDYSDKEEVACAVRFYEYISGKEDDFLEQCNYSREEVLEGLRLLAENAGYGEIYNIIEGTVTR